jgi:hypothetical protein
MMCLHVSDADPDEEAIRSPPNLGMVDDPPLLGNQPEQAAEDLGAELGRDRERRVPGRKSFGSHDMPSPAFILDPLVGS